MSGASDDGAVQLPLPPPPPTNVYNVEPNRCTFKFDLENNIIASVYKSGELTNFKHVDTSADKAHNNY